VYLQKNWEYNEALHQLFTDFNVAYDSVWIEVLYNILFESGKGKGKAVPLQAWSGL